jgi:hypothetical protein
MKRRWTNLRDWVSEQGRAGLPISDVGPHQSRSDRLAANMRGMEGNDARSGPRLR